MSEAQTLPRRAAAVHAPVRSVQAPLPLALSARVTNIVYTAQVQVGYACAV